MEVSSDEFPDQELNQPLLRYAKNGAIKESLQNKIACRLWDSPHGISEKHKAGLTTYFAHFQKEINLWSAPKQDIAIDTYNDFLDLVRHLTTHKDKVRGSPEILEFFPEIKTRGLSSSKVSAGDSSIPLATRYRSTTQEEVDNAIKLTIGLWLMIYLGPSNPHIFLGIGRWHIEWPHDMSLKQAIAMNFDKASQPAVLKGTQFPKDLNVHNLERIGGFQIMWTSSLKNHLAFNDETMTIVLYHFSSILSLHESNSEQL